MEDQKHILALEALYIKFSQNQNISEDQTRPKQRKWWPAAPVEKTSPTAHPQVPPSPPQLLWPHHKLTGASSALLNRLNSTINTCSSEESNAATNPAALPLYAGIFLAGRSKERIIQCYPPRHSTVYCHHITLKYFGYEGDLSADLESCLALPLGSPVAFGVTGAAADAQAQALAVTLPSWVPYTNSVPSHVTVSVVDGVQAKEAGTLVATAVVNGDIEPIHGLRVLHGVIGVCLTDRSVVYTRDELLEAVQGSLNEKSTEEVESSEEEESGEEEMSSKNIGISSNGEIDLAAMMRACFNMDPAVRKDEGSSSVAACSTSAPLASLELQQQPQRSQNTINAAVSITHALYGHGRGISRPRSRSKRHCRGNKPKHALGGAFTKSGHRVVYEEECVRRITAINGGSSSSSALSPFGALSLEIAENERTALTAHHQAYQETQAAFNAAQASGDAKSARNHAHKLKKHAVAAAAARRRASAAAFHAHNAEIMNTFRVDLHGMHVKDAINALKRYVDGLEAIKHPGGCLLQIVTGFGKHSVPQGRAKVLPAVIDYLADSGLLFDVEENNPGVVRVLLEPLRGWWL